MTGYQQVPVTTEENRVVSPDEAKAILSKNPVNRKIKARIVEAYARDMSKGKWLYTGDAIRIDNEGNLIDGQHRLQAAIMSNSGFYTKVITGLPRETMLQIDAGAKRNHADQLSINGIKYPQEKVAALRLFIMADENYRHNKSVTATRAYTNSEIMDMLDIFPDIEEDVRIAYDCYRSTGMNRTALCTFLLLARYHSEMTYDSAVHFAKCLTTGANLAEGDPILALRSGVIKLRDARTQAPEYLALLIKIFNKHVRQEKITRLPSVKILNPFPKIAGT